MLGKMNGPLGKQIGYACARQIAYANVCLGVVLTSPLREEKTRVAPRQKIYDN